MKDPVRTLLHEVFVAPPLRSLQQMFDFIATAYSKVSSIFETRSRSFKSALNKNEKQEPLSRHKKRKHGGNHRLAKGASA
jgi:hypothetical protein